jgi:hypothetical protein
MLKKQLSLYYIDPAKIERTISLFKPIFVTLYSSSVLMIDGGLHQYPHHYKISMLYNRAQPPKNDGCLFTAIFTNIFCVYPKF